MNNGCTLTCPLGYYMGLQAITNYDECFACQSDCVNCTSYDYCVQCNSSLIEFNGLCLSSCPICYYALNSGCSQCSSYCASCINSTYCNTCIGTYLYNHLCVAT